MRLYDEPIAVRSGDVDGERGPVAFVWRRRLWQVLSVETRWRDTADWWSDPGGDLLAESEVWRVLAAPGRTSIPGVYELAHPLVGEQWFLRAVMD